jgi:hypothetical protein
VLRCGLERRAMPGAMLLVVLSCHARPGEPQESGAAPSVLAARDSALPSASSIEPMAKSSEAAPSAAEGGAAALAGDAPARMAGAGDAAPARTAGAKSASRAPAEAAARRKLLLERPFDLGPATAIAASPSGVLFRRAAAEIVGVRVVGSVAEVQARASGARPAEGALSPTSSEPVVTRRGQSYWVRRGQLLRRAFSWTSLRSEGETEVLSSDALDGARIAAISVDDATDLVAYIARPAAMQEERRARLWTTAGGTVDLSESGAGASSVALVEAGDHAMAVWIDARAAMSPVHARSVAVNRAAPARLGNDVVVFVGPSPEGLAEVSAVGYRGAVTAFIPFARDTTAFGLAALSVGSEPHLDAEVTWTPYPNGIEPAKVSAAVICGAPWVAFVRPREAAPESPAGLMLAALVDGLLGEQTSAAEGFGFYAVSLAARDAGGAWLAWVGNGRTWVRGISCP